METSEGGLKIAPPRSKITKNSPPSDGEPPGRRGTPQKNANPCTFSPRQAGDAGEKIEGEAREHLKIKR